MEAFASDVNSDLQYLATRIEYFGGLYDPINLNLFNSTKHVMD